MTFGRNIQNTLEQSLYACFSFRVGCFYINLSFFKPDTENNANFENYASHCQVVNMAPFSKEDKIWIKSMYEWKGYNGRLFITEFPDKCGKNNNVVNRLLVKLRKFRTV